jgi:uncharacterized lipoprotein YmbA
MTRRWRHRGWFALGISAMLVACSSPEPVLYTISPVDGATHTAGPRIIVLEQIGLERYLNRSEIVRSSENYRLNVMSNDWWGEPLAAMLSRILVAELGQRLPQSTVLADNGAISSNPDVTVQLNMQRLDEDATGSVVLQAQAGVQFKGQKAPALRTFHFVVAPSASGVPGEVAAISAALGQLADGVAAMLISAPTLR